METGQAINYLRKSKNITQQQLSDMVGITQASLSHIENGAKTPHKSTLIKLCNSLNIPIEILNVLTMDNDDLKIKETQQLILKLYGN